MTERHAHYFERERAPRYTGPLDDCPYLHLDGATTRVPVVHKMTWAVPVSDEAVVDYRLGTIDDQVAAARLEERRRERERRWRALPRHKRWIRTVRWYFGWMQWHRRR